MEDGQLGLIGHHAVLNASNTGGELAAIHLQAPVEDIVLETTCKVETAQMDFAKVSSSCTP